MDSKICVGNMYPDICAIYPPLPLPLYLLLLQHPISPMLRRATTSFPKYQEPPQQPTTRCFHNACIKYLTEI